MVNIIRIISKYLILIFMALYVWKCFSYFTAHTVAKRKSNLNHQIVYIFLIHALCHICMFLNTREKAVIMYYFIEILIAGLYLLIFHKVYREASRLITNNIAFLMLIGYTILYRLSPSLARKQFILATVALFLTGFIPAFMKRMPKLREASKAYAIIGIAFLLTVFVPHLGVEVYGSRNWISIAGIGIQPMEIVKIFFILYIASSLVKLETFKELFINALVAAVFCLILVAEKDFGAMFIFYICYVLMVYLATSRVSIFIGGIGLIVCGVAGMYLLFKDTSFFSHILVRVEAWRDPFKFQTTGGYQVCESLFAIGTGGLTGTGLGKGMPYLIPVAESDFIFSAICEELGVLFGLALLLIYVSSFIAIINIAMRCRDPFYKYMTFGMAMCYIIQVFLNVGGAVKFIPSTGVTLPLVSYGLSSVFSTLIMFSMIQYTYIIVSKEASDVENEKEEILQYYERKAAEKAGGFSGQGE
jgi:Bacterial cell division membrane protein